ncbi:hypothetical protein AB0O87_02980 [Microbacterium sp. NPDC076768]|uniref:hypothetical protein n=1 Tax=Microbacterium sp. NPDC076768 TaxID=3154858 RepID=UPI0034283609
MTPSRERSKRKPRWEQSLLAALAYPANLVLGAVAVLILALPVVTAFSATIALARAFAAWTHNRDDAVFTNTFRQFALTWRRSLPLSIASTGVLVVVAGNIIFLAMQLANGSDPFGLLIAAAMLPFTLVLLAYALAVAAASARIPDATRKEWVAGGWALLLGLPRRSLGVLTVAIGTGIVSVLIPTMAPFLVFSLPVYAAVRLWPTAATGEKQDEG